MTLRMHPLLHLVASQPQLLADHAAAYAELVAAEAVTVSAHWQRRLLLGAVAVFCLLVGAILAGVALMLWAVLPTAQILAPWALLVAPLLPLALAIVCLLAARAPGVGIAFENLRRQMKADMAMLREAGKP